MSRQLRPDLSLRQGTQLRLSPLQQQAIKILEMPLLELRTYINQQLEENPLLEEDDVSEGVSGEALSSSDDREEEHYEEVDGEPSRPEVSQPDTLYSFLRFQLQVAASDEIEMRIGEEILGSIDRRGYFQGDTVEIAQTLGLPLDRVTVTLAKVQTFEPVGVGARDLRECLLLQLRELPGATPLVASIVAGPLEEAMNPRQQRKVAKSLGCTREELSAALEEIHQLDPFPGCNFTDATPSYILPDLLLVDEEGKFRLELNVSHTPRLRISPSYQRLLADPQASTFLKKKLTAAKWVLRSLEKREDTLARVGSHLVEKQEEFLRKGGYYLKPLSLREVAQALEVHESTISRAVKGKYIDTPRGVFPLRVLLPAGLPQQGGPTSESRLKEEIRRILAQEDKSQPLSDEEIARSLEKAGIHLARRTVTKYRKSLGIPIRGKRKVRTDRY